MIKQNSIVRLSFILVKIGPRSIYTVIHFIKVFSTIINKFILVHLKQPYNTITHKHNLSELRARNLCTRLVVTTYSNCIPKAKNIKALFFRNIEV